MAPPPGLAGAQPFPVRLSHPPAIMVVSPNSGLEAV